MNSLTNLFGEALSTPQKILTSKNSFLLTAVFLGAVIGIGLVGNRMNKQNQPTLMPAGFDTTALGPFSNDEIKSMWTQWRLNYNTLYPNDNGWAQNKQFLYVAQQIVIGGNQVQTNDPVFGNGPGGFNVNFNTIRSGLYVVIVLQQTTSTEIFAALYQVVSTIGTNGSAFGYIPENQVTYPNTYQLNYITVINNITGNKWYY